MTNESEPASWFKPGNRQLTAVLTTLTPDSGHVKILR